MQDPILTAHCGDGSRIDAVRRPHPNELVVKRLFDVVPSRLRKFAICVGVEVERNLVRQQLFTINPSQIERLSSLLYVHKR